MSHLPSVSSGGFVSISAARPTRYDVRMDAALSAVMIIGIFYMVYYITDGM